MTRAMSLLLRVVCAVCLLQASAAAADDDGLKEYSVVVDGRAREFTIRVDGSARPENVEITIENVGGIPVVNPRLSVNGKYDWFDIESMVAEITAGCRTDEEKAMAIFDFVEKQSYWWSYPKDITSRQPVRHFNVYGYHICSQAACEFVALCRAAGVDARVYEIWHHTVAEAYWDGAWHHMDPDIGTWFLKDDNRTVASMAELEQNPDWVARSYKPYRWYMHPDNRKVIYKPGAWPAGEGLATIYDTEVDNYVETGYDDWLYREQTMALTLRPDEKLVRWWKPVLRKYYDRERSHEPPAYANGQLVFEPDFGLRSYEGSVERENVKFACEDGVGPDVHVDRLQTPRLDRFSRLIIPMKSPYVIVGGYVDTRYYKGGTSGLDQVSLHFNPDLEYHRGSQLWNYYSWAYGLGESRAWLDDKMPIGGPQAMYGFEAEYRISANAEGADTPADVPLVYGGQAGVEDIRIVADLQVNPRSLPALELGENRVSYTAESDGEVRITWKWREVADQHAPEAPVLVGPAGGNGSLAPEFVWRRAEDADGDEIACYRFQLSLRPDCAWPLASTFDRDVRGGVSFQTPEGWLNPGTTYYWRVKAEDSTGRWSGWSETVSFTTR